MERVEIQLSELTLAQKLNIIETIWDDISRCNSEIESPHWHEEILKDRERALAAGKANVSDWEEARVRIKRNVS